MWVTKSKLILASASPRRRDLLTEIKVPFEVKVADVDETPLEHEDPSMMVKRLSAKKALSVKGSWVLGADTTVVLNGENLGKPESRDDAFNKLKALQGSWHIVLGGVALVHNGELVENTVIESSVKMVSISDEIIKRYIETKEPMDKAGAYAIQGIGSQFIEEIKGSYSNVVGLDISWVVKTLLKHQIIS